MKLNISARLVCAVLGFCAPHEERKFLRGVYVEPLKSGGATIVASNGHAIVIWRDAIAEVDEPVILNLNKTTLRVNNLSDSEDGSRVTIQDDQLALMDEHGKLIGMLGLSGEWRIEGVFPDWRKLIPDNPHELNGIFDFFDSRYVGLAAESIEIGVSVNLGVGGRYFMRLNQLESGSPVVVTTENKNFMSLIMPIRAIKDTAKTKKSKKKNEDKGANWLSQLKNEQK